MKEEIDHEIMIPEHGTYRHTWRLAAVCWGETIDSKKIWTRVKGYHWFMEENLYDWLNYVETHATDCSVYDGWWDN